MTKHCGVTSNCTHYPILREFKEFQNICEDLTKFEEVDLKNLQGFHHILNDYKGFQRI